MEELLLPVDVAYVSLDSRKRDKNLFPSASQYHVNFDRVFKDVVSVELVYALYAKFGDEEYVNLYIEELVPNMISNCSQISGSFTQLPLMNIKNEYTSSSKYRSIKVFPTPMNKLARFSIRFIGYEGQLYPIREHMLRFEIKTLKFHMKRPISLTRENVSAWTTRGTGTVGEVTNEVDVMEAEMSSRPLSDSACRTILGLTRPYTLQNIIDAFKRRSGELTLNPPEGINRSRDDLKRAFKILARRTAERNRSMMI